MAGPKSNYANRDNSFANGEDSPRSRHRINGERAPYPWEHWLPQPERQRCGARTRNGKPCRNMVVNNPHTGKPSNRCRMHGGYSTGPRTAEGKAASLAALARGRESSIARRSIHHKVKSQGE
jgi:hypothetical protein